MKNKLKLTTTKKLFLVRWAQVIKIKMLPVNGHEAKE